MKHILALLLVFMPIITTAQTLTDAQKREAQQCATQFCNLLTRFSNGERTLNSQINALCSGADCSAYDDIKTNKEVTLRNYLMAIQQKYPRKLDMTITTPSMGNSKTYVEPVMSMNYEWGKVGNGDLSVTETLVLSPENVSNIYVVFDVVQNYPTLGKTINKKLIYDTNAKKITAFITNNGAFISFLNGVLAFSKKDFKTAIEYFDKGAQNDRSSLKKICYGLAMTTSFMLQDMNKCAHYAELYGDSLYIALTKAALLVSKDLYEDAGPYYEQLEKIAEQRPDMTAQVRRSFYLTLANFYALPMHSRQDMRKAMSYFKKAEALGSIQVGYLIFALYTLLGEDFVAPEDAFDYLQKSAESGYPPAFYQWGRMVEYGLEDKEEALRWYEKAAHAGNCIGMASAGKLLIEKGEKSKGVEWLKKSLNGKALEAQLEDCELATGGLPPWPKTREDVETLLNKYNNGSSSYSNTNTSSSTTSYTVPNSSTNTSSDSSANSYSTTNNSYPSSSGSSYYSGSSSSSYGSSSSYSDYSYQFNGAKDNYCVGISVGYVQKQWTYELGETKESVNVFGENKNTKGFQFGIRIDPQFGYGFGINTGLFYEYYWDRSEDMYEEDIEYYYKSEEHCLYMPIHLKYSLNFSKWFQLAFYGGIGLDYGMSGKIYLCCDNEVFDTMGLYDEGLDMHRFNTSLEYGASLKINRFQLHFTMSKGLTNMSDNDEYKVKLNKQMAISATISF